MHVFSSEHIVKLWIEIEISISFAYIWENVCTDCQEYRINELALTASPFSTVYFLR